MNQRTTIIVEGVDCSGKSTLTKELKNHLKWDLLALPHSEGDQFERYLKLYGNAQKTILERSHLSEKIYSQVFGRSNPFTLRQAGILHDVVAEKALLVVATAPSKVLRARYVARSYAQELELEKLDQTNAQFLREVGEYPECLVYNSATPAALESIMAEIKRRLCC